MEIRGGRRGRRCGFYLLLLLFSFPS